MSKLLTKTSLVKLIKPVMLLLFLAGCGGSGVSSPPEPVPSFTPERWLTAESATVGADGYYTEGTFSSPNHHEGTGGIVKISNTNAYQGSCSLDFAAVSDTTLSRIKDRTELYLFRNITMGTQKCTAFSFKLADDFPAINKWFLLHQWHQSSPESPPIALEIRPDTDNELRAVIRYGQNVNNKTTLTFDTPISKGQWIQIVALWKVDLNNGIFKVWVNGQQKFNYTGPIGYSNVTDMILDEKFGIYRYTQDLRHEIFYDEIKVGSLAN